MTETSENDGVAGEVEAGKEANVESLPQPADKPRSNYKPWIGGVAIGVASGLIISAFTGITGFGERYFEKRDQVRYLVAELAQYRTRILCADEIDLGDGAVVLQVEAQWSHYRDMRESVESILEGRASLLSYDEANRVRQAAFALADAALRALPEEFRAPERPLLSPAGYEIIFSNLEAIDWLELPERASCG